MGTADQKRTGWTPERVDTLRRLWGEGLSANAISWAFFNDTSDDFCVSRNAVIGKLHRLGLKRDRKTLQRRYAKPAPAPEKPAPRSRVKADYLQATRQSQILAAKADEASLAPVAVIATPPSGPVHFIDRRTGQCAWPLWDEADSFENKLCCGEPVEAGSSYCATHARVAADRTDYRARWTEGRRNRQRAMMLKRWGSAA